jgi:hypothetical protein
VLYSPGRVTEWLGAEHINRSSELRGRNQLPATGLVKIDVVIGLVKHSKIGAVRYVFETSRRCENFAMFTIGDRLDGMIFVADNAITRKARSNTGYKKMCDYIYIRFHTKKTIHRK